LSQPPSSAATGDFVDLHCHILPGLDDGAETMDVSLAMARLAAADGVGTIVATPHIFRGDHALKDPGAIGRKCDELNRALKENVIPVQVLPGAEVHISHDLIAEIRADREHLVLNRSSYLFVEFPSEHVFSGIKDLFFELMSDGITPIITHPERNAVFCRNPGLLYELIQMGALSQANAGSFEGRYGRLAAESVCRFLSLNLVHFIASDGHDARAYGPRLSAAVLKAEPIVGRDRALALVRENSLAVIKDGQMPPFPPPTPPKTEGRSFKIRIPRLYRPKK